MRINLKTVLDTRRVKQDGLIPIVTRIYKDSKFAQIPSGYSIAENKKSDLRKFAVIFKMDLLRAQNIIVKILIHPISLLKSKSYNFYYLGYTNEIKYFSPN